MKTKKSLDWEFIGKLIIIFVLLSSVVAYMLSLYFDNNQNNETNENIPTAEPDHLTMSQFKMKEAYGWKEIILWKESKEDFEKAYEKKIQYLDFSLSFKMNPTCCEPYGCSGNWDLEKICFEYIVLPNQPDILQLVADKSYGKTLVVIGNTYRLNDVERFVGQSWWCE